MQSGFVFMLSGIYRFCASLLLAGSLAGAGVITEAWCEVKSTGYASVFGSSRGNSCDVSTTLADDEGGQATFRAFTAVNTLALPTASVYELSALAGAAPGTEFTVQGFLLYAGNMAEGEIPLGESDADPAVRAVAHLRIRLTRDQNPLSWTNHISGYITWGTTSDPFRHPISSGAEETIIDLSAGRGSEWYYAGQGIDSFIVRAPEAPGVETPEPATNWIAGSVIVLMIAERMRRGALRSPKAKS